MTRMCFRGTFARRPAWRRAALLGLGLGLALPCAATRSAAAQTPATPTTTATPAATTDSAGVRRISLDEALRMAEAQSEAVQIARAGVTRATGQHYQARSQYLPQLNGIASYTRTLKSQFQALGGGGGAAPDTAGPPPPVAVCAPEIPANATAAERQAALDAAVSCQQSSGLGIDFSKVGFGAKNQYVLGLSFSQSLFSGGRVQAQNAAANAGLRAAEVEVTAQRAQLALDVAQAYFDAALADRLVAIADSTLVQTEDVYRQTSLARRVGEQSEFELLRAQVARDNQRPVVIQARANRETAYLRLKQLINVPLDVPVALTSSVEEAATTPAGVPATLAALRIGTDVNGALVAADTSTDARSVVRESEAALRAQEAQLRIARSERYPQLSLTSNYQRLYFPQNLFPTWSQYAQNWTVGLSASLPIFTGGRIRGDELVARGNLEQARAQLQQARELAALDTRVALSQLTQAEAAWSASSGTVEQAQRAYQIDQVRYREGISTQTEIMQSRILLQQATANRASAARDLALARMRVALIRDLPIQLGSATAASQTGASRNGGVTTTQQQQQQAQQQQQQQSAQQQAPGQSAGGLTQTGQPGGVTP